MSFYYDFRTKDPVRARIADRLVKLRRQLRKEVPSRNLEDTLLLATWNIRELDSSKGGVRKEEPLYYIAEILSSFDLVAIQEVREDLKALERLRDILGRWWKFIVTDVTEGTAGNRERMAFLYDSRKIRFGGVAGEVVIPPVSERVQTPDGKRKVLYHPAEQLYRTPFLAGFQSSWFRFMLCTTHIVFGKAVADDPKRIKEIELIANFFAKRTDDKKGWSNNMILLGDFNIFSRNDKTLKALTQAGFVIPEGLQEVPGTNVGKVARHYDQIAFRTRTNELQATGQAGVFDFFKTVYRTQDEDIYAADMGARYKTTTKGRRKTKAQKTTYYKSNWRTFQMSDHLPMWVELKIDFGEEYLKSQAR